MVPKTRIAKVNIFMCEYMTGIKTLAKVKKYDRELDIDVELLKGLYS